MGDAAWPSGKVVLMCPSHGYLLYLEAKNICTRHSSDSDKGEIVKECISPDFSIANDRILFQNALSTLLTSLGVSQGQQDPGSQAKALKFCLSISSLSLFSLCVSVIPPWPDNLFTHGDKRAACNPQLTFFQTKIPKNSLPVWYFVAKVQNPVSGSAWVVLPSLKQLWQPSKWYTLFDQAESCLHPWCWGWGKLSELRVEGEWMSKIKSRWFPQKQGMDPGQTDRRKWSTKMCCNMNQKNQSEVAQSCPTLRGPMDGSPPGSSIHGIFQARVLEWGAISFSRRSSQPRNWTQVSHIIGRCFTVWATREVLQCEGTLKTR